MKSLRRQRVCATPVDGGKDSAPPRAPAHHDFIDSRSAQPNRHDDDGGGDRRPTGKVELFVFQLGADVKVRTDADLVFSTTVLLPLGPLAAVTAGLNTVPPLFCAGLRFASRQFREFGACPNVPPH